MEYLCSMFIYTNSTNGQSLEWILFTPMTGLELLTLSWMLKHLYVSVNEEMCYFLFEQRISLHLSKTIFQSKNYPLFKWRVDTITPRNHQFRYLYVICIFMCWCSSKKKHDVHEFLVISYYFIFSVLFYLYTISALLYRHMQ